MSFGKNKAENSQTFDPQLKNALLGVFGEGKNLYNSMPYVGYDGALTAPMSNIEMAGMQGTVDAAQAGIGRQEVSDAMAGARQAMQYQPLNVQSGRVGARDASVTGFGTRDAAARQFGARDASTQGFGARDVGASQFGARDVGASSYDARDIGQQSASRNVMPIGQARDVTSLGPSRNVSAQQVGPLAQVGRGLFNPFALINEQRVGDPMALGADQVSAERLRDTSLSPYQNTYENQVVQSSLDDIERARQMQQNQNAAQATASGAFGGDRQGIVQAETNRAALEQSARTAAALRQSGYESAAQRAEGDITRNLTSQQLNQGSNLQAGQFTRGQQMTADQANQRANLESQTRNVDNEIGRQNSIYGSQVQNVGNELARQQSNQNANLQGALANQAADSAYRDSVLRGDMANQGQDSNFLDQSLRGQMANQSQDASLRDARFRADSANQAADLQRGQSYTEQLQNSQRYNQAADLTRGQSYADQLQNSQRYNQQSDLARGQAYQDSALRAQMANQSTDVAMGRANQDALLRASMANQSTDLARGRAYQDSNLRASMANQQADLTGGRANLDAYMQAQLANQSANQAGAQFRLGAGTNLAGMGNQMRGLNFADANAITGVGQDQRQFAQQQLQDQYGRYMDQREWPFKMFDLLRAAGGILPNPLTSQGSSSGWNIAGSGG